MYINLDFKDTTEPSIIIDTLKGSIRKETEAVYRKKQIKEEIENCKEELSFEQKCVLVLYLCKFTEDTKDNRAMFYKIFNVEVSESAHISKLLNLTRESQSSIYHIICSIRNKEAIDTFISFCCSFSSFLMNKQSQKEFCSILSEWGYNETEIRLFINDAIHRIVIPENPLYMLERPFPLSIEEQEKIFHAYLMGKLYNGYSSEDNPLSSSQKCSLFATVVSLCHPHHISNDREDIIDIVADYAVYLNLEQQYIEKAFLFQTTNDRDKNLEVIKSIKDNDSLMHFIAACKNIIDVAEDFASINSYFHELLLNIGYTIDECVLIDRGEHVYKHKQNSSDYEINTENADALFIYNWTLKYFMRGRDNGMEIKYVVNRETGEDFRICVLEDDIDFFVSLFLPTYLEHLTPAEILERSETLKVGVTANGNFCLYNANLTFDELHYLGI